MMSGEGRVPFFPAGTWLVGWLLLALAAVAKGSDGLEPADTAGTLSDIRVVLRSAKGGAGLPPCATDTECDDGDACTTDTCEGGLCVNQPIPACVSCVPDYVCPALDIVFIVDTSGSMRDEAAALCSSVDRTLGSIETVGLSVLGITETPLDAFGCLDGDVVTALGSTVPGEPTGCRFPDDMSAYESWGPGTAIVAERFHWTDGAIHVIVPVSDEGPCNGNYPDGCNDPGDDRDSIGNAIEVANTHGVIVSPITGTGSNACVMALANHIATGTGGTAFHIEEPSTDVPDAIVSLLLEHCDVDDQCDDGDACTTNDTCVDGVCLGGPPPDCNDDNVCTDDSCDPDTGCVHLNNHDPCDDGDPCTLLDVCDGQGNCVGTDISTWPCTSDVDCFGAICNQQTGFCVCSAVPELCLEAVPGQLPVEGCYGVDEELVVYVSLGASTSIIAGGQFLIGYDPTALEVLGVTPGATADPNSPFSTEFLRIIDEEMGRIFYAVGIPIGGSGTRGPAIMAAIHFRPLERCATLPPMCLLDENPRNTRLTDIDGLDVPFIPCCTDELVISGNGLALECPGSVTVNADAPGFTALVTWNPIQVSADCGGQIDLACTATHSEDVDVEHLIETGGEFPAGISEFECTASDSCGVEAQCAWRVQVNRAHLAEVTVQLSPTIASYPLQRCIVFEFYSDCVQAPVIVEEVLEFGSLFDFPGYASDVPLKIPPGQYVCATARDPLHTLRAATDLLIVDGRYVAVFRDTPRFDGNWLIGGNLNDDHVIDILDFGIYVAESGKIVSPDTQCGTPSPHADINGDGIVDALDLSFIQVNLGAADLGTCCSSGMATTVAPPVLHISAGELELMGFDAYDADMNEDGIIDEADITAGLQGAASVKSKLSRTRK